jgi:hypothetical protein
MCRSWQGISDLTQRVMMPHVLLRSSARWFCCGLVSVAWIGLGGCEPPPTGAESAAVATDLPAFSASEAALFDDTIALGVFGADLEETDPAKDPKLRERVGRSDAVVPVKVSTVTSDTGGELQGYQLVVLPTGAALHGKAASGQLILEISSRSPAYPFVKSADAALVGRALILMYKRYNENGAVATHWRLEADTDEIRKAIAQASALEELGP